MDPRSFPLKLTPEDRHTMATWKWRLAAVHGSVLVVLVLIIAAAPRHKSEIASTGGAPELSAAAMVDGRATP